MLVIHIGPRKTATTYLQSNFYRNRKELLSRGWLYPVLSLQGRNAHHALASSLRQIRAGKGALVQGLQKAGRLARQKQANILISSEGFRKWKAEDFQLLGKQFGQDEIVIAYALRDPLDLLLSVWSETVKNGRAVSLKSYVDRQLADPLQSPVINCLNELLPIMARPELRLVVLNFEALKRSATDVYTAFGKHVLGLDNLVPVQDKLRNPSFSQEVNDFLRLVAREIGYDPGQSEILFSRQLSRTHSTSELLEITETIRRVGGEAREPIELSRDLPWYEALEMQIRDALGDSLVPPATEQLFSRGLIESVSYDIDGLARQPDVQALLSRSIPRMRAARSRWGRSRLVGLWRYLRRMISV